MGGERRPDPPASRSTAAAAASDVESSPRGAEATSTPAVSSRDPGQQHPGQESQDGGSGTGVAKSSGSTRWWDDWRDPEELRRQPAAADLLELDERYSTVLSEHKAECLLLRRKYQAQLEALLEKRREVLQRQIAAGGSHPPTPSFWRAVLQNSPDFAEDVERHDEPVLDYLQDVRVDYLDEEAVDKGFRVRFYFDRNNPYFDNKVLEKVYHTERPNRYYEHVRCVQITSSTIDWRPGKDVTVELLGRKTKGGSRRRPPKQRREEVPRPSFFRTCFRNLGPHDEIPEEELADSDGDESVDLMDSLISDDFGQGLALLEHLVPHAVRWFTGEGRQDGAGSKASRGGKARDGAEGDQSSSEQGSEEGSNEDQSDGAGMP